MEPQLPVLCVLLLLSGVFIMKQATTPPTDMSIERHTNGPVSGVGDVGDKTIETTVDDATLSQFPQTIASDNTQDDTHSYISWRYARLAIGIICGVIIGHFAAIYVGERHINQVSITGSGMKKRQ